jgi:hypothetical protein
MGTRPDVLAHFMWSLPWFPPALYRSLSLRTPLACHLRYSPESLSPHSSVSVSQPVAMALLTLFRLTTIRLLSASSPGIVLVPCIHGRFYEQQRPGVAELSFLLQQSSRYSRRHYQHPPPVLYHTVGRSSSQSAAPGVGFAIVAASGRLRHPILFRGLWSVKRSGSASRGFSHHRRLHHFPALCSNSPPASREVWLLLYCPVSSSIR